jgi:hypothetical protein
MGSEVLRRRRVSPVFASSARVVGRDAEEWRLLFDHRGGERIETTPCCFGT